MGILNKVLPKPSTRYDDVYNTAIILDLLEKAMLTLQEISTENKEISNLCDDAYNDLSVAKNIAEESLKRRGFDIERESRIR